MNSEYELEGRLEEAESNKYTDNSIETANLNEEPLRRRTDSFSNIYKKDKVSFPFGKSKVNVVYGIEKQGKESKVVIAMHNGDGYRVITDSTYSIAQIECVSNQTRKKMLLEEVDEKNLKNTISSLKPIAAVPFKNLNNLEVSEILGVKTPISYADSNRIVKINCVYIAQKGRDLASILFLGEGIVIESNYSIEHIAKQLPSKKKELIEGELQYQKLNRILNKQKDSIGSF